MIIVQLLYEMHDVEFLGLLWRFSSEVVTSCVKESQKYSIAFVTLLSSTNGTYI